MKPPLPDPHSPRVARARARNTRHRTAAARKTMKPANARVGSIHASFSRFHERVRELQNAGLAPSVATDGGPNACAARRAPHRAAGARFFESRARAHSLDSRSASSERAQSAAPTAQQRVVGAPVRVADAAAVTPPGECAAETAAA